MTEYRRKPGDRIFRPLVVRPWKVLLPIVPKPRTPISSSLLMIWGFAAMIFVGGILLMLPVSSQSGQITAPIDAFFTAASATCVTGLVVVDTADYWSRFGQTVIVALMQLGGFGFMVTATFFLLAFGRRIGLREKIVISESIGVTRLGGVVRIIAAMAGFTLVAEAAGAAGFYFRYAETHTTGQSIWLASFQSVSAFNNAGFDLSGGFRSLVGHQADPWFLLLSSALIVLGGISLLVVLDVFKARFRFSRLSLDSKLVLAATAALLVAGTGMVLLTESFNIATLGDLAAGYKVLNAFFQSVTSRTAGFSTINMAGLANYTLFVMVMLMFIGGASGSTAGGMKVNNFGMLTATVWSTIKGREHAGAFGREFSVQQINRAMTVLLLSVGFICLALLALTLTEDFRFIELVFETVSAFSTVGLSVGITPQLTVAGRIIILLTMFVGRLGPLTMALALVQRERTTKFRYRMETIRTA
jgi:trk system potassium uptake protein